ncbi:hypothetical protein FB451DRAFT_1293561 [Mycena latifolia]|nr:hypothetical protein FB451DRAFT_1293561 [Mycena latifolia]
MLNRSPTVLEAAVVLLAFFLLKRLLHFRGSPLPPGPRPWLGVLALPSASDKEWLTYGNWGEQWGGVTSVTVFGQPLNSFEAATDILDKKSSIYSDRPVL